MSVTISTLYQGLVNQSPNLYSFTKEFTGTGDGSGGTVNFNGNIEAGLFKPEDLVYLKYLNVWQNDANTTFVDIYLNAAEWSKFGGRPATSNDKLRLITAYGGSYFTDNANVWSIGPKNSFVESSLPLSLGKPMVVNPNIVITFSPNTNLKTYSLLISFDIYRKPQS